MATIGFNPRFSNNSGFERLASGPAYNIEVLEENQYEISLVVAGFERSELDIQIEKGVLTVTGHKAQDSDENNRQFLHRGISVQNFKRQFNLADHVEVMDASLQNGLLQISLRREIPEAMKPKTIPISDGTQSLQHQASSEAA